MWGIATQGNRQETVRQTDNKARTESTNTGRDKEQVGAAELTGK